MERERQRGLRPLRDFFHPRKKKRTQEKEFKGGGETLPTGGEEEGKCGKPVVRSGREGKESTSLGGWVSSKGKKNSRTKED